MTWYGSTCEVVDSATDQCQSMPTWHRKKITQHNKHCGTETFCNSCMDARFLGATVPPTLGPRLQSQPEAEVKLDWSAESELAFNNSIIQWFWTSVIAISRVGAVTVE